MSEQQQTFTIQQAIDLAVQHHKAGRLPQAEAIYQRILNSNPNHSIALHLLGLIVHQEGKNDLAVDLITKSLAIKPDYAEAHSNLGRVFQHLGKLDDAIDSFQKALALKPAYANAHNNLGTAFRNLGRLDDAVESYRKALAINPGFVEAHSNLGLTLQGLGRLMEAVASHHKALSLKPDYAEVHNNLGIALSALGRLGDAVASHRKALSYKPNYAEAHYNLGNALKDLGKLDEAVACYHRALDLNPDSAEANNNLGNALKDLARLDDSLASYRKALDVKADYAPAHNNIGNVLRDFGQLDDALASFRKSLAIKPDYYKAHSNLLLALLSSTIDLDTVFEEHCLWEKNHAMQHQPLQHQCDGNADKRLRVGFVSADLLTHSVSYFLEAPFSSYDRDRMEIYCYSNSFSEDETTTRLQSLVDEWRNIAGWQDEKVIGRIQADGIDILVDLSGHTKGHRLKVFARKPAPIQVTWLGYPSTTTGLTAIDYKLSDDIVDPPGVADSLCVERMIRLPNGHHCYQPPVDAPEIGPLPNIANQGITFGSFNNLAKITPEVVDSWSHILQAVPRSRLLLKNVSLASSAVRERYLSLFAAQIDPERIVFKCSLPLKQDHFALYNDVDIALDTFPFNGVTTTCEALWMGVPVVTWRGDRHQARIGASLLTRVGLGNLVAPDIKGYEETAVALAGDPALLEKLRSNMRNRLQSSPLCDGTGFARDVEKMLRSIWHKWCEKQKDRGN